LAAKKDAETIVMLRAARAPVRPRIIASATEASLPLEDEVERWLDEGQPGSLQIVGGPGSGKSTALAHLAAIFPEHARLRILDDPIEETTRSGPAAFTIFVGAQKSAATRTRSLSLAPWNRDELIEYLLGAHPRECASVMTRITKADFAAFAGVPELWRIALDELAADPSLAGPPVAIVRFLRRRVPSAEKVAQLEDFCLKSQAIAELAELAFPNIGNLLEKDSQREVMLLLRHRLVRRILATERLVIQLENRDPNCDLSTRLPHSLVAAVGAMIAASPDAIGHLTAAVRRPREQAMAASLLHAAVPGWVPSDKFIPLYLDGAHLSGVKWPGLRLRTVGFRGTDLTQADLGWTKLDDGDATNATFVLANLQQASLNRFRAATADFSGADLTGVRGSAAHFVGANLKQATLKNALLDNVNFDRADLRWANFEGAQLTRAGFHYAEFGETNFRNANLTDAGFANADLTTCQFRGACLQGARLMKCVLEGMRLDELNCANARFDESLLTGSSMARSDLSGASLRSTGLADVEWPGACLRDADFRQATFHMGSSRSGLVDSVIASEGTRTGFYTDDYNEQDFKSPEEIRKANLTFCDLRGALVEETDFYLVDLRGALYDARQAEHFRRSGAILEDRCGR
jgi:uncharacterized protein YjbI with pentapeptide repeats/energy-coupling factor transporter ATP-binding protein EcfA2